MIDGGKGDARRPMAISDQQYAQRWDLIFGRDRSDSSKESNREDSQRVGLEGQAQRDGERQEPAALAVGHAEQTKE